MKDYYAHALLFSYVIVYQESEMQVTNGKSYLNSMVLEDIIWVLHFTNLVYK